MDLPGAQQGYKPGEFVDITWTSVTVKRNITYLFALSKYSFDGSYYHSAQFTVHYYLYFGRYFLN